MENKSVIPLLYVAATPIGNLQDITYRAAEILKRADVIFCEDTRVTAKLTSAYGITARLMRYNEHNNFSAVKCIDIIKRNKISVLVSDSGTPCISDPGYKLVAEAKKHNIKVSVLPGPAAVTAALSIAGTGGGGFVFLGFLPKRKLRAQTLIKNAMLLEKPVVIYESPFRIIKLLELVEETFPSGITVTIARELTKVYEEILTGSACEIKNMLTSANKVKGEFVLILHSAAEEENEEQGN